MDQGTVNTINMLTASNIFVDTSAFVSLWDDKDPNHIKAIRIQSKLKELKVNVYVSSDIIGETLTVISRKLGKENAIDFLEKIQESNVQEIFIDEFLHKETRKFFRKIKSKNISFIDCSSVIVMKRSKVDVIFSFDEDFRSMGVKLLGDII